MTKPRTSQASRYKWWIIRPTLIGLGLALGAVTGFVMGVGFLFSSAFGSPGYLALVGLAMLGLSVVAASRVRFFLTRGWRRAFPPDSHLNVLYHDRH